MRDMPDAYKPVTKPEAKYEALKAAVATLESRDFEPDELDFPRDRDRAKISAAYGELLVEMRAKLAKLREPLAKKGLPV